MTRCSIITAKKGAILLSGVALLTAALTGCGAEPVPEAAPEPTPVPVATPEPTPEPTPTPNPLAGIESLALVAEDGAALSQAEDYPDLKALDLSGSTCYDDIMSFIESHPDIEVTYTMDIGGTEVSSDATTLKLRRGKYDIKALMDALPYLPEISTISLGETEATKDEILELCSNYSGIDITWDVPIRDEIFDSETDVLDISDMSADEVYKYLPEISKLTNLTYLELMNDEDEEFVSPLEISDVLLIEEAVAPATVHYVFDFYGQTISTTDDRIEYEKVNIGNDNVGEVYQVLDVLQNCTYFKLADCGIDSEKLAEMRDAYPNTKIVWRVYFASKMHCLTDETTINSTFSLNDSNCSELKYCTEVKYMDIGHDEHLYDISFIEYMPDLEILIVSGSPMSDISCLANHEKLIFAEFAYCSYLKDISPLASCPNLQYINLSYTKVKDLTPIWDLPLKRMMYLDPKVGQTDRVNFKNEHPDCWTTFFDSYVYGKGWRYEDAGITYSDIYKKVREVFRYDDRFYNHS